MSEQNFALTMSEQMQEMRAELAAVRAELDRLKTRPQVYPSQPTTFQAKLGVSTTRRSLLRRLAGGLVAGLAAGGAALVLDTPNSQANSVVNPASANGQVGSLSAPPGKSVPTGAPTANVYMGLVSTDGVALNLSALPTNIKSYSTGVLGYSGTDQGRGIIGLVSGNASTAIYGFTTNTNSEAVHAETANTASNALYAITAGTDSTAVNAITEGANSHAVLAHTESDNSFALYGFTDVYAHSYAVYGFAENPTSYAGYFRGNVSITDGTLTKPAGSFKIDHPLDPANQYLYHSFVESPDMLNIYNGIVTLDQQGQAIVKMPEWFEALNSDFRYQLTALDSAGPNLHIASRLAARKFKIAGGQPGQAVSWLVTGIRQDAFAKAHRIPVEEAKIDNEKGKYLHPELFGQSEEMSVHPRPAKAR